MVIIGPNSHPAIRQPTDRSRAVAIFLTEEENKCLHSFLKLNGYDASSVLTELHDKIQEQIIK